MPKDRRTSTSRAYSYGGRASLRRSLLIAAWLPPLAACAAMTVVVGNFPGVAVVMQPPAAGVVGPAPTDAAPGPHEPTHKLAVYIHNVFDSGSDLRELPALRLINMSAVQQELAGTSAAVRLPHLMAGGVVVAGRNGAGRLDCDLHATVLAALIGAVPSGEIIPPNPPQIPAPPPPTAQQIAPPPPIAAPPPPQQLPPPPPQREEPPAAVPSPGGANGSGGSGDGGAGDGGGGAGGPGGDGGDGPAAPLPTAAMPPGGVRLSP
jgi:uncharacterized membrane protein YgcG